MSEALRLADAMIHYFDERGPDAEEVAAELRRLHAENEALKVELERERMRLVACGVVAMADTPDSAKNARQMHPDYESASCADVARRVDECIELRTLNAELVEALRCADAMLSGANMDAKAVERKVAAALAKVEAAK